MLTAACLAIALATLGSCCLIAYWVGRTRKLREGEGYLTGRVAGIRLGRDEGLRERDALREELADVRESFSAYVRADATAAAAECARGLIGDDTLTMLATHRAPGRHPQLLTVADVPGLPYTEDEETRQ